MKKKNHTVRLAEVFGGLQDEMKRRMEAARKNVGHPVSKGNESEAEWIELFQHFLPQRYKTDRAYILDCNGAISEQMDVVIFDRQYSPFLAKFKEAHYIPAESVYAVFEVKQDLSDAYMSYAGKKAASVRNLHRTATPIQHAGGTHSPRPQFGIITGLLCQSSKWKPAFGAPFQEALERFVPAERLDCGCCLNEGAFFVDWQNGTPETRVSNRECTLITFVLGLIRELQKLGTVSALDLDAYLAHLPMQSKSSSGYSRPSIK